MIYGIWKEKLGMILIKCCGPEEIKHELRTIIDDTK